LEIWKKSLRGQDGNYPKRLKIPFCNKNKLIRIIIIFGRKNAVVIIIKIAERMSRALIQFKVVKKAIPFASKNKPRTKIKGLMNSSWNIPNSQKHKAITISRMPKILMIIFLLRTNSLNAFS